MSEKRQAWEKMFDDIDSQKKDIEQAESALADLRTGLSIMSDAHEVTASDYAEERVAEGANAIERNGTMYMIKRSRKGKGGVEPRVKFYLEEVKK